MICSLHLYNRGFLKVKHPYFETPTTSPTILTFRLKVPDADLFAKVLSEVYRLNVPTFPNRDKRNFVHYFKEKHPKMTIKKICKAVGIAVSFYYKPKRNGFYGVVIERTPDPIQLRKLEEELKKFDLKNILNRSKRYLVKYFKEKYHLLTIKKICQLVQIKSSTYYYSYIRKRLDPILYLLNT